MTNKMQNSVEDLLERLQILDMARYYIESIISELDELEKKGNLTLNYNIEEGTEEDMKFDFGGFRKQIEKAYKYLPDDIAGIDNAKRALADLLEDKKFINCDLSKVRKMSISAKAEFARFTIQNPSSADKNKKLFKNILSDFTELAKL